MLNPSFVIQVGVSAAGEFCLAMLVKINANYWHSPQVCEKNNTLTFSRILGNDAGVIEQLLFED